MCDAFVIYPHPKQYVLLAGVTAITPCNPPIQSGIRKVIVSYVYTAEG